MRRAGSAVLLALAAACGHRPEPASGTFDAAAEFVKVTAAHAAFAVARSRLEQVKSAPSGQSEAEAQAARVREAEAAYDTAYANDQGALAGFLNQALNLAPARPETREALAMYAEAAVANAGYLASRGGDGRQALPALAAAERAYRALRVAPPAALSAALAQANRPPTPATAPTATPRTTRPAHRRHRR